MPVAASTANALTVPLGLPSKVLSSLTAYRYRPEASNARYDGLVIPVFVATGVSAPVAVSRRKTWIPSPLPCRIAPVPKRIGSV